jgi:SSS family solute:Na+ symporter
MHWVDILIFIVYMIAMLGVGYYFLRTNKDEDDYYVGGRNMSKWHVGLSVVATDVGGGFSIGLGGLGFTMGISGSWMLFTGLVGAWLAAVFLIPKVRDIGAFRKLKTFPEIFGHIFTPEVAVIAGIISAIGYWGFTSSQILAGAKLATATFPVLNLQYALWIIGIIAVVYTAMGGLKAVIYTDTVQWILLLGGLIFIGLPLGYYAIGGWEGLRSVVQPEMLSLSNLSWSTFVNWLVTILPIWFVGMTLYQRIYACKNTKEAKQAWYIAGFFEYPIMAFMGVLLGLFARVAADQGMFTHLGYQGIADMDSEMGLPLLLREVLPVGLMGLMMSAYFSAILSTADSCLMAASGNIQSDIFKTFFSKRKNKLLASQILTLGMGVAAVLLASQMTNVLTLMLYSYAFMVSGLLVPLIAGLFLNAAHGPSALTAMLVGGLTTVVLTLSGINLPLDLDPNIFGITLSAISYGIVYQTKPKLQQTQNDD